MFGNWIGSGDGRQPSDRQAPRTSSRPASTSLSIFSDTTPAAAASAARSRRTTVQAPAADRPGAAATSGPLGT